MFTCEDVAEVRATISADDFGSIAVGVGDAFYGAGDFVIETRPAAMRIEFVGAAIKRSAASFADVCSAAGIIQVFAGIRGFSAFIYDYAFLFRGELSEGHFF